MFDDRRDAGRRLARAVRERVDDLGDAMVLALPRGGVIVGREVADALGLPLDVVVVRKLGAPGREEYAVGAIAEGGVRVVDDRALGLLGVSREQLAEVEARENAELRRRAVAYRAARGADASGPPEVAGRTALVVDDGVATGATAAAACRSLRARGARRILIAVPVAPPDWRTRLADEADGFIAVAEPEPFGAVGAFYRNFAPTTDAEVAGALA